MPTIVELYGTKESLDEIVRILNMVKMENTISDSDLEELKSFINNSLVGASKLLHFLQPANFPNHYQIGDISKYRKYEKLLKDIEKTQRL